VLQCEGKYCVFTLQLHSFVLQCVAVRCKVSKCVAACVAVCVAVCVVVCEARYHCVAVCCSCSVLHYFAVYCSV